MRTKPANCTFLGRRHSEETRMKMRLARLGKRQTAETRKKMSDSHKGKKYGPETLAKISAATSMENNGRWRGGKKVNAAGYVLVKVPDHPFADKNGYVRENRLVAEAIIGRYLRPEEIAHHRNGNRADNSKRNIVVIPCQGDHRRLHATQREA